MSQPHPLDDKHLPPASDIVSIEASKFYYRIVSYISPRGFRFYGEADISPVWRERNGAEFSTKDYPLYFEAKMELEKLGYNNNFKCEYFDGEHHWHPDTGWRY